MIISTQYKLQIFDSMKDAKRDFDFIYHQILPSDSILLIESLNMVIVYQTMGETLFKQIASVLKRYI